MEDRYLSLSLADVLDRAGLTRDRFARPLPGNVGSPLDPVVGTAVEGGAAAPTPGTTIPDDVRPGDLIRAQDWNLVLAVLRRLAPALAADAGRIGALEGKVAALEGAVARLGTPWWVLPERERELTPFEKVLLDPSVFQRVASKREIVDSIVGDPEIRKILEERPELLEEVVRDRIDVRPETGPVGGVAPEPGAGGGSPSVAGGVGDAEIEATRITAAAGEVLGADATLKRLVTGSRVLSERFGLEARGGTRRGGSG